MAKIFSCFSKSLLKAKTEEEVKHAYAEQFGLDYDTEFRHDLYSPEIFFEFKFSRSLQKRDARAAVLAQVMYYARRLRLGYADKVIPPVICVADSHQAFFTDTIKWRKFYDNESKYDWELAPGTPDGKLVADLAAFAETNAIKVFDLLDEAEYELFSQRLAHFRATQLAFDFRVKKLITEENFEEVFDYWNKCELYHTFFKNFKDPPTSQFKVEYWDAGWWQVKKCLVEAGLEGERFKQIEEMKKRIGAKISSEAIDLGIIFAS
jgi:hypothetical protein